MTEGEGDGGDHTRRKLNGRVRGIKSSIERHGGSLCIDRAYNDRMSSRQAYRLCVKATSRIDNIASWQYPCAAATP